MQGRLAAITLYPIKSLDGVSVSQARITRGGSLQGDRSFCLVDENGLYVNGKRQREITHIRASYDLEAQRVSLGTTEGRCTDSFQLEPDNRAVEQWFSDFFRRPVRLQQDLSRGFPDDEERPGPTLISTATLETVQSWFPDLSLDDLRRRFRSNLEVGQVPAFWEDQLGSKPDSGVPFRIGECEIIGLKPCQRCAVPCLDPDTGEVYPGFQRSLPKQREASLPEWANRAFFTHYYYLALNTKIPAQSTGKRIMCDDRVELCQP